MKSIIEEASSISKAIETAWIQAGKPSEFTVRIFEESQKNMFGFTSKPAKIGIFFEESKKHEKPQHHTAAPRDNQRHENQKYKEKEVKVAPAPKHRELPVKSATPVVRPKREETEQQTDPWNEQMVAYTNDWMSQLLKGLNVPNTFAITPERYHLKISFNGSIFDQPEKNRVFFRSCAHLLLQSIRNNFKRPLKGFKVILTAE